MKMEYDNMSDEAKETVKGMVEFCIKHGYCMGMNQGINESDNKEKFRIELEAFSEVH